MGRFVIAETAEIDAPAEIVWQVISDLRRYGEWNPFVVSAESTLVPGEPIEMLVSLAGKIRPQREWIVSCEPGVGFAYNMTEVPAGMRSHRSHRIEPIDAGRSLYSSHFHLEGWLRHLVLPLLRHSLQQGFAGMTAGIKSEAERLARGRDG